MFFSICVIIFVTSLRLILLIDLEPGPKSFTYETKWVKSQEWEFFYVFLSSFLQKYMIRKKITKLYIWRRGGRRQGPTAVPHGGMSTRGTVAPVTAVDHGGRGTICFQNIVIFLFELGWS
jgi:hypothetical protein